MYIRNRYDRDNTIIKNPSCYIPKNTAELEEILAEIYSEIHVQITLTQHHLHGVLAPP
mgnify:CR=1 FL=1